MLAGRAQAALLEAGKEGAHGQDSDFGARLEVPLEPPAIGPQGARSTAGELFREQKGLRGIPEGVSRGFFCG